MNRVLVIGSREDPHVSAVAAKVTEFGGTPTIIDARSPDNAISITFAGSSRKSICISAHDERVIDCGNFKAVWFRLKPVIPMPAWGPLEASAATFAQGEWRTVLRSLDLIYARWINPIEAQAVINSKPRQLNLAMKVGLVIPETVVTNDPKEVLELMDKYPRVIYKALNGYVFPDQSGILTTEITRPQVVSNADKIRRAPGIYQEFVEKEYELRITIVGTRIFPALVRTPRQGLAAVDWRHAHFEDIFENCQVDSDIAQKLLRFHREAGLVFGTYDLIVARTGAHVFLECNPAGQFLWLEHSLGLPISACVAQELCKPPL